MEYRPFKFSPIFSPDQDLEIANRIHILVVPVGNISQTTFKYYLNQLKRTSRVKRESLNLKILIAPKSQDKRQKRAFNHGDIYLKYIHGEFLPNEWSDFHLYKKVFCIVGIAHCPKSPNLRKLYQNFLDIVQRFKTSSPLVWRCIAFEPPEELQDPMLKNLYPIPMVQNVDHLMFYLDRIVADMITDLNTQFQKEIKIPVSKLDLIQINTDNLKSNSESNILKKAKSPRRKKVIADYALLSGQWEDAKIFYKDAMDQLHSLSDWVYYAGCVENLCCARILLEKEKNGEKLGAKFVKEIREKQKDAILIYDKKKAFVLKIESLIKLAQFLLKHGNQEDRETILTSLGGAYSHTNELEFLEQILLLSLLASLYSAVGYKRKVSFFLRETAIRYKQLKRWELFHNYLLYSTKFFQLENLLYCIENKTMVTAHPVKKFVKKTKKWSTLQIAILMDLILAAKSLNDNIKIIEYSIFLLKIFYNELYSTEQKKIFFDLKLASLGIPPQTRINMHGFPQIISIDLVYPMKDDIPIEIESDESEKIFIFNPEEKKKKNLLLAKLINTRVCGELINFKVTIENPFHFDIIIEKITLKTDKKTVQSFPIQVNVPALSKKKDIILSIKVLEPQKQLSIIGCEIEFLNLIFVHPFKKTITVVKELPRLGVTVVNSNKLNLLEGQFYESGLVLQNISSQVISRIFIQKTIVRDKLHKYPVNGHFEKYYSRPIIDWKKEIIKKNLPLKPGENFYLPLLFCARKFIDKVILSIRYEGKIENNKNDDHGGGSNNKVANEEEKVEEVKEEVKEEVNEEAKDGVKVNEREEVNEEEKEKEQQYYRSFEIPFELKIREGISIKNFNFIKPDFSIFSNKKKKKNSEIPSMLMSLELKNHNNNVFTINCRVLNNIITQLLNKQSRHGVDGDGDGDGDEINLINYNEKDENSHRNGNENENENENENDHNFLNKNIILNYQKTEFHQKIILEPYSEKRIIVPIPRFNIPNTNISGISTDVLIENYMQINHVRPNKEQIIGMFKKTNLKCILMKTVAINWISDLKHFGQVPLYSLKNFNTIINKIDSHSIISTIIIPKNKSLQLNKFEQIKINLKNVTNILIKINFSLEIRLGGKNCIKNIFESDINTDYLENTEKNILWVGSLKENQITIPPSGSYHHSVFISFVKRGRYFLNVKVTYPEKKISYNSRIPTIIEIK
ncbi:trafficking protein particle complex subunit 9 [Anaeramoeba flamelloides]|uniref:Trafficking protein particle complex subunit 9 n=1 Tax=Anaeramoeba flamelloides TaxID=1746091 RepID=A0ABQ8YYG7_9EUKA|nr:trafficking protein particle complex subunit 9 [Anaeramoeba flamelloides]